MGSDPGGPRSEGGGAARSGQFRGLRIDSIAIDDPAVPDENVRTELPFGTWPSPLSAVMAARGGTRFGGLALSYDRTGRALIWFSALEQGNNVVWVSRADGVPRSVEAVSSARSRVNEYGGGAFWAHGESLYWVEDEDQRIRRLDLGDGDGCLVDRYEGGEDDGDPLGVAATDAGVLLTAAPPSARSMRYAAGVVEPGGAWMVAEREFHTHHDGGPLEEAVNDLVWLPTGVADAHPTSSLPSGVHLLVGGSDFVAAPALSPDGAHLAWLQWNHPDMPWDAAELWAGALVVGPQGPAVDDARRIAGGRSGASLGNREGASSSAVSVCLPKWDPLGRLWWCDDRDDLWILRHADDVGPPPEGSGDTADPLRADGSSERDASGRAGQSRGEVGVARWVSGGSRYGFAGEEVVFAETSGGLDQIHSAAIQMQQGSGRAVQERLARAAGLLEDDGWVDTLVVGSGSDHNSSQTVTVVSVAGTPTEATAVVCASIGNVGAGRVKRFGGAPWPLRTGSISVPRSVTFPTGPPAQAVSEGGEVAHALFYPPKLDGFAGVPGELPPLVVRIHGGPTAAARGELSPSVQFWTTRGFAVADVNYRGSVGYGRTYRDELLGGWGEVEVQDCIAAAEFLARNSMVDPHRCAIRGGSAGGFTALEAVAAEPTASGFHFGAATTLYGVTDLLSLATDTHKFESRYLDGLIGPLPEAEEIYRSRSPMRHPERIASPVLVLQGLDDPVVPPSQAEALVGALAAAGIDHEYRTYEGEGHGFRAESTLVDALEAELAFYQRVLGMQPAA